MPKNEVPVTYMNKDGKPVEISTGRVLKVNKDGSISKWTSNMTVETQKKGLEVIRRNSHYTGDDSGEHWERFFAALTKSPLELSKAASIAGFHMTGVRQHMNQNKALQERFNAIMDTETDNLENNIRDIAYEDDKKYLPTKLRANETLLNARAKDRGYGVKQNAFNVEGNMQINVINNTQVNMPGTD